MFTLCLKLIRSSVYISPLFRREGQLILKLKLSGIRVVGVLLSRHLLSTAEWSPEESRLWVNDPSCH